MNSNYHKLILQLDLSIIYWLTKYKLIESNQYLNKLISEIENRESAEDLDTNNNINLLEFFTKNSSKENFKIIIFHSVIEKWMSIVSKWQLMDFKLTKNDYSNVKTSISRTPIGIIGLCGDIALVSPFIHKSDIDYESNRLINQGLVPYITYLNSSNNEDNRSPLIYNEILNLFLIDAEKIWGKIKNFIKNPIINNLSQYINNIIPESHINTDHFNKVKDLLSNIKPFPTICYIVGSNTNKRISKLEEEGHITKYQTLLDSNIELMTEFLNEHFHCLISRFRFLHIDLVRYLYTLLVNSTNFKLIISELSNCKSSNCNPNEDNKNPDSNNEILKNFNILNTIRRYGIGGTDNWYRVKCLHSHYAYTTSFGLFNSVTLNYINSIKIYTYMNYIYI